jgi:hypothetical protein
MFRKDIFCVSTAECGIYIVAVLSFGGGTVRAERSVRSAQLLYNGNVHTVHVHVSTAKVLNGF